MTTIKELKETLEDLDNDCVLADTDISLLQSKIQLELLIKLKEIKKLLSYLK